MKQIIVASTLHDPQGSLDKSIKKYGSKLKAFYDPGVVAVTPQTPEATCMSVRNAHFEVIKSGESRRETYAQALSAAVEKDGDTIFYCDFDRLLHWVKKDRAEYNATKEKSSWHDFVVMGRTDRAFKTHPLVQRVHEAALNAYCSERLETGSLTDFCCGTFSMDKRVARIILELCASDLGVYAEWPVVGCREGKNVGYYTCEGLEWETPDRFEDDIKKNGYDVWRAGWEKSQWALRKALLLEGIIAIDKHVAAKNI